jgi:crossover junction endodeoxyribonuclease RuvC
VAAARAGVPVREATPSEVKVAVSGDGRADKEQIGRMVQLVLGLERVPSPDDAADALAVAIWAANVAPGVEARRSAVVDRAAVAPITRGRSAYDQAVADALARERAERRTAS